MREGMREGGREACVRDGGREDLCEGGRTCVRDGGHV